MNALQVITVILAVCIILAILLLSSMMMTNRHDTLLARASALKGDIRERRKDRYRIGKRMLSGDAELSQAINAYPTIRRERDEVAWERKWLPRIRRRLGTSDNAFTQNEEALSSARDELAYVESEIAKIEGSRIQMGMIRLFVRATHGARRVRDGSEQARETFTRFQQSAETQKEQTEQTAPRQYGTTTYFKTDSSRQRRQTRNSQSGR